MKGGKPMTEIKVKAPEKKQPVVHVRKPVKHTSSPDKFAALTPDVTDRIGKLYNRCYGLL